MIKNSVSSVMVVLLIVILGGCSSEPQVDIPDHIESLEKLTVIPKDQEPAHTIDFKQTALFGETEQVLLGDITGMTVDEQGRVYLGDGDQEVIHVYKPNAQYLRKIGSEGKGPGEFTRINSLRQQNGRLYAYDSQQHRVNVFSLDSFAFSHAVPLTREISNIEALSNTSPKSFYVSGNGKLLVSFIEHFSMGQEEETERSTFFYWMDQEGNIVSDKIIEQKAGKTITGTIGGGPVVVPAPFGRKSIFTGGPEDTFYGTWNEDFLIKKYNAKGEYQQAIYYPYSKSPLEIEDLLEKFDHEGIHDLIRNAERPDSWPVIHSMKVDDQSRIWVSTITNDRDSYQWWVIGSDGKLLAKFTWPRSRSLKAVKDGSAYTHETDDETGVERIVRYNIEMSEAD